MPRLRRHDARGACGGLRPPTPSQSGTAAAQVSFRRGDNVTRRCVQVPPFDVFVTPLRVEDLFAGDHDTSGARGVRRLTKET